VLIVLADSSGARRDMYAGAWDRAWCKVLLFCLLRAIVSFVKPQWVPGIARIPHHDRWPLVKVPCGDHSFLVLISSCSRSSWACHATRGAMGNGRGIVLAILHRRNSRARQIAAWSPWSRSASFPLPRLSGGDEQRRARCAAPFFTR